MNKYQVIFFGFTDNDKQETIICKDLGEAHDLFDNAFFFKSYKYIDITLNDNIKGITKVVRKWSFEK